MNRGEDGLSDGRAAAGGDWARRWPGQAGQWPPQAELVLAHGEIFFVSSVFLFCFFFLFLVNDRLQTVGSAQNHQRRYCSYVWFSFLVFVIYLNRWCGILHKEISIAALFSVLLGIFIDVLMCGLQEKLSWMR